MNYFKGFYEIGIAYSPNYYGTLNYAPPATVLLYNDKEGYCIGYMERELPEGVVKISEDEAINIINMSDYEDEDIWFGEKLLYKWNFDFLVGDIYV